MSGEQHDDGQGPPVAPQAPDGDAREQPADAATRAPTLSSQLRSSARRPASAALALHPRVLRMATQYVGVMEDGQLGITSSRAQSSRQSDLSSQSAQQWVVHNVFAPRALDSSKERARGGHNGTSRIGLATGVHGRLAHTSHQPVRTVRPSTATVVGLGELHGALGHLDLSASRAGPAEASAARRHAPPSTLRERGAAHSRGVSAHGRANPAPWACAPTSRSAAGPDVAIALAAPYAALARRPGSAGAVRPQHAQPWQEGARGRPSSAGPRWRASGRSPPRGPPSGGAVRFGRPGGAGLAPAHTALHGAAAGADVGEGYLPLSYSQQTQHQRTRGEQHSWLFLGQARPRW